MLELADRLLPLVDAGVRVALATAIDVVGSSPHPAGTSMALTERGDVIGSVSGGCVEAAALEACERVLATGTGEVRRFGFGDAEAALAGLACGGEIDVLVHLLDGPAVRTALADARDGRAASVALVTAGPAHRIGTVAAVQPDGAGGSCDDASVRVFVDRVAPARRMVVVGATAIGAALATAAATLGYRVTVIEPRAAFAQAARVRGAELVHGPAHEHLPTLGPEDAVCVLGHDEELDPLTLAIALEGGAGYVGALGSRATHARRVERMRALGVAEEHLARLHGPVGLDVGAVTPAEIAVAVLAEVLAVRTGASGRPLRDGTGPIRRPLRDGTGTIRRPLRDGTGPIRRPLVPDGPSRAPQQPIASVPHEQVPPMRMDARR